MPLEEEPVGNPASHSPSEAPAHSPSYLKSPSWYLSKAWRMMVIKAMTGFTMQNCSVAWEGWGKGVRLGWGGARAWGGVGRPPHLLAET